MQEFGSTSRIPIVLGMKTRERKHLLLLVRRAVQGGTLCSAEGVRQSNRPLRRSWARARLLELAGARQLVRDPPKALVQTSTSETTYGGQIVKCAGVRNKIATLSEMRDCSASWSGRVQKACPGVRPAQLSDVSVPSTQHGPSALPSRGARRNRTSFYNTNRDSATFIGVRAPKCKMVVEFRERCDVFFAKQNRIRRGRVCGLGLTPKETSTVVNLIGVVQVLKMRISNPGRCQRSLSAHPLWCSGKRAWAQYRWHFAVPRQFALRCERLLWHAHRPG